MREAVPAETTESQKFEAYWVCQQFVKDRLKAPATAKFAGRNENTVQYLALGGSYVVTSYVDSQNSFGALLRTSYNCRVLPKGEGNWGLIELTTTP